MVFDQGLQAGILLRRYKRFLAEVELPGGEVLTVHCPNSGSMQGCLAPGSPVMISRAANPARKYPYTLEMIRVDSTWVGINTGLTNRLVKEALLAGRIEEIGPLTGIESEVKVSDHSRLDFLCRQGKKRLYLEVKNCTLAMEGWALFPDAVTARGTKHLQELLALSRAGHGAAVLFCVQRADAERFRPAAHIDPLYAETLREVHRQGVLALAYRAAVSPERIKIVEGLQVFL
ncbi:MAG: DNA/RNA nuclease SfsA [Deltaproteobacteria bacterium]|jgi:sugar fermentation stimulation protein A